MGSPQVVAVLGASGFIGRYVVRRLARAGHLVRAIVRRPSHAAFLRTAGDVGQVEIHYGSITQADSLIKPLDGADRAINLVGILYEKGRRTFDAVHHLGPKNFAQLCYTIGIRRLVHVSALAARDDSESLYARSKAAGETAVRTAFPGACIVRPSLVFGPEDNFFNLFAHMAVISPILPLLEGGKTLFQPVYVDDVAQAIVQLALTDAMYQDAFFELGGPETATFEELLKRILRLTERKAWLVPLPRAASWTAARLLECFPTPLLTRDQLILLKTASVVSGQHPTFADLGLEPTPMKAVLPSYLARYRPIAAQA